MEKKRLLFKTFGCRTNIFDTAVMQSKVKDYEIVHSEALADCIIINSCTVTNGADSNVRAYISKVERQSSARIYLTGCGAHSKGEDLYQKNRVFSVFGQSEKERICEILDNEERLYDLGNLAFVDSSVVAEYKGKCRAFLKIQEGCSFRCSYCIIPQVRGDSRSIDEATILEQVNILAQNGYGEFVLTGTNVGSYSHGHHNQIAQLMQKMSAIRGVRRIRLGSIEPIQINEAFMEILHEPWLERHLHIALQHTSPTMLKRMNRRNHFRSDHTLLHTLHEQGFALGTDFIVGHPGESEDLWQEGFENFKTLPITHLHGFSYSARDNTASAMMKQDVNGDLAKQRLSQLQAVVDENNYKFRLAHHGALEVLIEEQIAPNSFVGYDQFYNRCSITHAEDIQNEWISIENYRVYEQENVAI